MAAADKLENLKLRASNGSVGSQGMPPYLDSGYVEPNVDYILAIGSIIYLFDQFLEI